MLLSDGVNTGHVSRGLFPAVRVGTTALPSGREGPCHAIRAGESIVDRFVPQGCEFDPESVQEEVGAKSADRVENGTDGVWTRVSFADGADTHSHTGGQATAVLTKV